jgi:hypothetical protein
MNQGSDGMPWILLPGPNETAVADVHHAAGGLGRRQGTGAAGSGFPSVHEDEPGEVAPKVSRTIREVLRETRAILVLEFR